MTERKKEGALIAVRCALAMTLFALAIANYDRLSGLDVQGMLAGLETERIVVAAVLVMYFVKGLIFVLPASVIYVAVGVLLETKLAISLNLLGIAIEVLVTYLLGRFLGGDYVTRLLSKKKAGRRILETDFQNKRWLILVTRLLPAFPIDFLSLFFGATNSSYVPYYLLSILGLAPRVILFTVIGDNLFKWIPMDKLIFIVICAIPVGVAAYIIKKLVIERRAERKSDGV